MNRTLHAACTTHFTLSTGRPLHPLHPFHLHTQPLSQPLTAPVPSTFTQCRLQLEEGYRQYNEQAVASGRSKGFFMVDICRPGHMTACLTTFQVSKTPTHTGGTASVEGKPGIKCCSVQGLYQAHSL